MTQQLFNPNDSITGRDGGPYLDEEEAREAEIRRARVEGREPDLEKPPATAGIPLVTSSELLSTATINNIPSQDGVVGASDLLIKGAVDDPNVLLQPRGERDVEALRDADPIDEGTVDPTVDGGESFLI
jgi:hypothetical protein